MAIEVFICPDCGGENRVMMAPPAERDVDCVHCRRTVFELIVAPSQDAIDEVARLAAKVASMPKNEERDALEAAYDAKSLAVSRGMRGPCLPKQVGCRFHVKAGG